MKKQIREIYSVASEKTEEYAKIGKKRLDILSLSRDVAREKRALGERVYELGQQDPPPSVLEDVTVKAILGRVRKLESDIGELEEEIGRIREEARQVRREREAADQAAPPGAPPPYSEPPGAPPTDEEREKREPPPMGV
ncbi:MAG: hypothetical protein GF355_13220 [Candidatus Eisenbacteria bacterium]|nr:hypothetical protein [Candidatus Eisenbacteria bacterium]